jgi:DnaJ-domain-containing protein 1
MTYGEAVRLIRQRPRTEQRARERTARAGQPPAELSRPELLGVAQGCTPDELSNAYHRKMSPWHPDKPEIMAQELKDYATRQTARINEAYQMVKSTTVQR